jgi:hypothetical protein
MDMVVRNLAHVMEAGDTTNGIDQMRVEKLHRREGGTLKELNRGAVLTQSDFLASLVHETKALRLTQLIGQRKARM